jgi:hypothetical protein
MRSYYIIIYFIVAYIFTSCINKRDSENFVLSKKERHELLNNFYRDKLNNGCVYLYDEPLTPLSIEDSIIIVNNVTFKGNQEYLLQAEQWESKYLDEKFYIIETNKKYESDTLFKNKVLLMLSQPIIDWIFRTKLTPQNWT